MINFGYHSADIHSKMEIHMSKNIIALMFVGLVSSCAVDMVKKTYSPTRSGTIRYSTGWFMADSNRQKAITEMNQYCSPGKGRIVSEESAEHFTGQSYSTTEFGKKTMNTSSSQAKENYVYLHFKCVKS
jgi:hypothetical protein